MESKKMLKLYGVLFIILAVADVAEFAYQYFFGNLKPAYFASLVGCEVSQANIFIIISAVIMLVVALLKLFLGVRAYREAAGEHKGAGYLKLATVLLVILGVLLVITVISSITQHVVDWSSICTYLVAIGCLMGLIQFGKAVKQ